MIMRFAATPCFFNRRVNNRLADILHAQAKQFLLRISDDLAIPLIDGDEATAKVGQGDAAFRLGKNGLQPRITVCQSGPRDSTHQGGSSLIPTSGTPGKPTIRLMQSQPPES